MGTPPPPGPEYPPAANAPPAGYAPPPGIPPPPLPGVHPVPAHPGNGYAIASLSLGAGGLFLLLTGLGMLFFLNLPCSILAWIFGVMGKRLVDRGETAQHRGLAQAGLILGVVGLVLGLVALAGWVLLFVLLAGGYLDEAWLRPLGAPEAALLVPVAPR